MVSKKRNIILIVLSVLLVLAVGYIGYDLYLENQLQKQIEIYQQGAQVGYEQAITQLFQQAQSCQQVPIFYNNQTLNIIAVECLQPQA